MISFDEDHGWALRIAGISSLVRGNADGGAGHCCCWFGWAPIRRQRGWSSWCWWCGSPPRRESGYRCMSRCSARFRSTTIFCRRGTLQLAGIQAWVAMISFLLSCVVVGRVAERARGQARQAEQRREDVERLYELSQEMMLQEDAAGLIRDLPRLIARIFALDGVVLYVRDQDQFYSSTSDLPMSIQASLRAMTLGQNPTQVIPGGFHGDDADAGAAAGGRFGPAAGHAFPRGGHGGQRAGGHRAHPRHGHRGFCPPGGGSRGRSAARRADRLADARVAHASDRHPRRRHHAGSGRGTGRSRAAGAGGHRR